MRISVFLKHRSEHYVSFDTYGISLKNLKEFGYSSTDRKRLEKEKEHRRNTWIQRKKTSSWHKLWVYDDNLTKCWGTFNQDSQARLQSAFADYSQRFDLLSVSTVKVGDFQD